MSTRKVRFGRVPEKGLGEYWKGGIRASSGKVEIWASTGKVGSGRVPDRWDPSEYRRRVWVSTEKVGSGRVPEMWVPGEDREGKIRVSTEKGRIRVSIGNGGIRVSTGKVGFG